LDIERFRLNLVFYHNKSKKGRIIRRKKNVCKKTFSGQAATKNGAGTAGVLAADRAKKPAGKQFDSFPAGCLY